eukprot:4222679-Pleurochrysis_carterae.AAC.2
MGQQQPQQQVLHPHSAAPISSFQGFMHLVPPRSVLPPNTPTSLRQLRDQLCTAHSEQSLEINSDMMRQRQLYTMDIEAKPNQHDYDRRVR